MSEPESAPHTPPRKRFQREFTPLLHSAGTKHVIRSLDASQKPQGGNTRTPVPNHVAKQIPRQNSPNRRPLRESPLRSPGGPAGLVSFDEDEPSLSEAAWSGEIMADLVPSSKHTRDMFNETVQFEAPSAPASAPASAPLSAPYRAAQESAPRPTDADTERLRTLEKTVFEQRLKLKVYEDALNEKAAPSTRELVREKLRLEDLVSAKQSEIDNLTDALRSSNTREFELKSQRLQETVLELENTVKGLENAVNERDQAIELWTRALSAANDETKSFQSELDALQARLVETEKSAENARKEHETARVQSKKALDDRDSFLKSLIEQSKSENESLRMQLTSARVEGSKTADELSELRTTHSRTVSQLESAQSRLSSALGLEPQLLGAQEEIQRLRSEVEKARSQNEHLSGQLSQTTSESEKLAVSLDETQREQQATLRSLEEVRQRNLDTQERLETARQQLELAKGQERQSRAQAEVSAKEAASYKEKEAELADRFTKLVVKLSETQAQAESASDRANRAERAHRDSGKRQAELETALSELQVEFHSLKRRQAQPQPQPAPAPAPTPAAAAPMLVAAPSESLRAELAALTAEKNAQKQAWDRVYDEVLAERALLVEKIRVLESQVEKYAQSERELARNEGQRVDQLVQSAVVHERARLEGLNSVLNQELDYARAQITRITAEGQEALRQATDEFSQTLRGANERHNSLMRTNNELREESSTFGRQLSQTKELLTAREEELTTAHNEGHSLRLELEQAHTRLNAVSSNAEISLSRKVAALENEAAQKLCQFQVELAKAERAVNASKAETETANYEMQRQREVIDSLNREIESVKSQLKTTVQRVSAEAREKLAQKTSQIKEHYQHSLSRQTAKTSQPLIQSVSKAAKALETVLQYQQEWRAREAAIRSELLFVKDFARLCFERNDAIDEGSLGVAGVSPPRKRTFAGAAYAVLAFVRFQRYLRIQPRPRISPATERRYQRMMGSK